LKDLFKHKEEKRNNRIRKRVKFVIKSESKNPPTYFITIFNTYKSRLEEAENEFFIMFYVNLEVKCVVASFVMEKKCYYWSKKAGWTAD
jgi:hypothetical protein